MQVVCVSPLFNTRRFPISYAEGGRLGFQEVLVCRLAADSKAAWSSADTDLRGADAPRWMLRSSAMKALHIRSPPSSRSCARIDSSLDAGVCRRPHAPM
jgi:hypothetical protein